MGSYLNVHHGKHSWDAVTVWERDGTGRKTLRYSVPRYFFVPDDAGSYTSIYGDKLKRLSFNDKTSYEAACKNNRVKFESDFRPADRILMDKYYGKPAPTLHYTLLDIEVDFKPFKHDGETKVKIRKKKS